MRKAFSVAVLGLAAGGLLLLVPSASQADHRRRSSFGISIGVGDAQFYYQRGGGYGHHGHHGRHRHHGHYGHHHHGYQYPRYSSYEGYYPDYYVAPRQYYVYPDYGHYRY